jgi:hypothetical protein
MPGQSEVMLEIQVIGIEIVRENPGGREAHRRLRQ